MSLVRKIRRGEGAFGRALKRTILLGLRGHLPASGVLRPVFQVCYLLHVAGRESLIWLCRFIWYEPLFRSQCEAVGRGFRMEQLPYMIGHGRITLGEDVELSGKPSICFGNALDAPPHLKIGDRTFVGHNTSFAINHTVCIGSHCLIAGNVIIRDYDGHPVDAGERRSGRRVSAAEVRPVRIGDDVWIGGGACVLKGVTIGDRSLVAAGAVVTKDVPQDSVVAGNPAQVVRRLVPVERASVCSNVDSNSVGTSRSVVPGREEGGQQPSEEGGGHAA